MQIPATQPQEIETARAKLIVTINYIETFQKTPKKHPTPPFLKNQNISCEMMLKPFTNIEIPRIKVGRKQKLETLIDEEALLLAKYLRDERKDWKPRIAKTS